MKRRHFVKLSAGSVVLPMVLQNCMFHDRDGNVGIVDTGFDMPLPLPEEAGASLDLSPGSQRTSILEGKTTSTFAYRSNILGPTIRAFRGEMLTASVQNALSEPTNVHWHGLKVPANMDGNPVDIVKAGESFQYSFPIDQRAGTHWYHPHPHGATARQVHNGLAGILIINDDEELALGLPAGDFEVPLVIQDKRLKAGKLVYDPSMMETMTGYFGQTITVNGVASPFHEAQGRWYRLRILNGSTARVYNLALSPNLGMKIIGSDGGLLGAPEDVNEVLLGPGERLDVLVDFSAEPVGSEVYLEGKKFNGGSSQGAESFKIMKFIIGASTGDTFQPPGSLSVIDKIPENQATKVRNFEINRMGMMGSGAMHTFNGKSYKRGRVDETVKAGATEIWEFDNAGDEIHPIHIHAVQFQILSRTGGRNGIIPSEKGWKDTVLILPKEKVRLIMTFPDTPGEFVFHCHNLEHEDDGMMLNFEIV